MHGQKATQQVYNDEMNATFVPCKKGFVDSNEEEKDEVYDQFKPKQKQYQKPDPSKTELYDMNAPIKAAG